MVISMVLKWTPRKTMQVEGAQSFSGEETKPRIEKSSSRVSNAIVALLGDSCTDSQGCQTYVRLPKWSADTSSRQNAGRKGGDVEIRKILVLYAEEVKVSRVNAQLTVGVAEILLEEKASRAFWRMIATKASVPGNNNNNNNNLYLHYSVRGKRKEEKKQNI